MSKEFGKKINELERDFTRLTTFQFKAKHGGNFRQSIKTLVLEARRRQIESDFQCYKTSLAAGDSLTDDNELEDIRNHQLRELDRES